MKYGLIGEKLGHSFSQEIHQQLFDYTYELTELAPNELKNFILGREFLGVNVTIPYKEAVIPLLDEVDKTAQRIGAVNTVVQRNGKLYGYNTDYLGLRALISDTGISLVGKTVLILGSGGTSKTALAVSEDLGCRKAIRVSRSEKDGCITYLQAKERYDAAEIIINTTPCGMFPHIGESAVCVSDFPALQGVIDVVYNPLRTKLVCDALEHGIPAVGGLYMLVAQAAYAAQLFTGTPVDEEKVHAIFQKMLNQKQNIVLIGMPGSGKTTIGKALSECLGCTFVDTDAMIVEQEGRPISEIFSTNGESYFRDVESDVIRQVAARQHTVIATGGGAVLRRQNIELLRENGCIVFLDRSLECLIATEDRPLSSNAEALKQRYHERYALYCHSCNFHVPADGSVIDVIQQIREGLLV